MTLYISCANLGFDCGWEAYGNTFEELVKYTEDHLIDDHHINKISGRQRRLIEVAIEEIEESDEDEEEVNDEEEEDR